MSEERQGRWVPPRASLRYTMDQRLVVRAGITLHGRTKDISESGLGATVAGELKMHESVELELYLPGSLVPQKFNAEVRYRRGFQYGFCFLNATDQQKSLIREAALYLTLVTYGSSGPDSPYCSERISIVRREGRAVGMFVPYGFAAIRAGCAARTQPEAPAPMPPCSPSRTPRQPPRAPSN